MKAHAAAILLLLAGCSDVCRSDGDPPEGLCLATYREALDRKTEGACAGACADWDVVGTRGAGAAGCGARTIPAADG